MSVQTYQTVIIIINILLLGCMWRVKSKKFKLFFLAIILGLALINPIKFKQEGMSKIERRASNKTIELPARVPGKTVSYEETQTLELTKLKNESKVIKNEINAQ